ncbi:hypothetical protein ACTA71_004295, partial [Dictyostelium dimigraforme]
MKYSQNKTLNKFEIEYKIDQKVVNIKSSGKMGVIAKVLKLREAVLQSNNIYYLKNHGDSRVIIGTLKQQIQGVLAGFCIEIKLVGLGYMVHKVGNTLVFDTGYSHYRSCLIPSEVLVKIEGVQIILYSINKETVTTFVSLLKTFKKVNMYKGTGILGKIELNGNKQIVGELKKKIKGINLNVAKKVLMLSGNLAQLTGKSLLKSQEKQIVEIVQTFKGLYEYSYGLKEEALEKIRRIENVYRYIRVRKGYPIRGRTKKNKRTAHRVRQEMLEEKLERLDLIFVKYVEYKLPLNLLGKLWFYKFIRRKFNLMGPLNEQILSPYLRFNLYFNKTKARQETFKVYLGKLGFVLLHVFYLGCIAYYDSFLHAKNTQRAITCLTDNRQGVRLAQLNIRVPFRNTIEVIKSNLQNYKAPERNKKQRKLHRRNILARRRILRVRNKTFRSVVNKKLQSNVQRRVKLEVSQTLRRFKKQRYLILNKRKNPMKLTIVRLTKPKLTYKQRKRSKHVKQISKALKAFNQLKKRERIKIKRKKRKTFKSRIRFNLKSILLAGERNQGLLEGYTSYKRAVKPQLEKLVEQTERIKKYLTLAQIRTHVDIVNRQLLLKKSEIEQRTVRREKKKVTSQIVKKVLTYVIQKNQKQVESQKAIILKLLLNILRQRGEFSTNVTIENIYPYLLELNSLKENSRMALFENNLKMRLLNDVLPYKGYETLVETSAKLLKQRLKYVRTRRSRQKYRGRVPYKAKQKYKERIRPIYYELKRLKRLRYMQYGVAIKNKFNILNNIMESDNNVYNLRLPKQRLKTPTLSRIYKGMRKALKYRRRNYGYRHNNDYAQLQRFFRKIQARRRKIKKAARAAARARARAKSPNQQFRTQKQKVRLQKKSKIKVAKIPLRQGVLRITIRRRNMFIAFQNLRTKHVDTTMTARQEYYRIFNTRDLESVNQKRRRDLKATTIKPKGPIGRFISTEIFRRRVITQALINLMSEMKYNVLDIELRKPMKTPIVRVLDCDSKDTGSIPVTLREVYKKNRFKYNQMIIRFKMNEIECEVNEEKEDITILQAGAANGIEIPRFCYHEKLTIAGNCRMCLVYVTNEEKLLAACGIPLDENFDDESIETEIDEILKAREGVMEFLLINHPLDCPICDQGGECDLQEQTMAYGLDTGRFYIKKRAVEVKTFGRLIKGIMTRCIHCTRCVRFLTEIAGVNELGVLGRGYNMEIGTYKNNVLIESELSGNIIDLCPVGALTSAVYAYKGRPWELKNVKGIDIFDNILTPINYQVKGGEIFRILPRINDRLNEEWITDKVRFHYESYKVIEKLRKETPSYKIQPNKFIELSWKTALKMVFKVLLNKKNKVDLIMGSKINGTNLRIYKELMNRLGNKNYITENGLMFKKFNYDFRENYMNSNDMYTVDQNDLVLLCGINLRVESPLLNIKLRNINFGDDEIETRKKIGIIGNKFDWKRESEYLGSTVNSMLKVFEGRLPYCQQIKKSKAPLIIVGASLLARVSLTLQEIRAAFVNVCNLKSENIIGITQGANFGMALEEGIFKENFSKGGNVLYSIDSNEFTVSKTVNYVIYQGILNDTFENQINLYLPSKHYFEDFEGDREVYVNTFGYRSEIEKLKISKGNKIKENSMIGYIQLMYLNNKE